MVTNGTKRKDRALDDEDEAQAVKHTRLSPPSPAGSRRRLTRSCRQSQNGKHGGSPSHDIRHGSEEAAIVVDDDSDEDWSVEAENRSPRKRTKPASSPVNGKSLKDMTGELHLFSSIAKRSDTDLALLSQRPT